MLYYYLSVLNCTKMHLKVGVKNSKKLIEMFLCLIGYLDDQIDTDTAS